MRLASHDKSLDASGGGVSLNYLARRRGKEWAQAFDSSIPVCLLSVTL